MNKEFIPVSKSFTLIELIVVIIIVGILAALGLTQYSLAVERSRLAEAKARIGDMRQLAQEYYWQNGTCTGITNADVGVGAESACTSNYFYNYNVGTVTSTYVNLRASRCTSGGKTPNLSSSSRAYNFILSFYPNLGLNSYSCWYSDDLSSCTSTYH